MDEIIDGNNFTINVYTTSCVCKVDTLYLNLFYLYFVKCSSYRKIKAVGL
jgi:hypothetical protein